jgi:hypothetical protein
MDSCEIRELKKWMRKRLDRIDFSLERIQTLIDDSAGHDAADAATQAVVDETAADMRDASKTLDEGQHPKG